MKILVKNILVVTSILILNFGVKIVFASNKNNTVENIELEKKVRNNLIAKIHSFKMDQYSYTEEYESYYENFKISKKDGMIAAAKLKEIIPVLTYDNIIEFHKNLELKLLNHNLGLISFIENISSFYYLICPINIVSSYTSSVKELEDDILSSEINKDIFSIIHDLEPKLGSLKKVDESANKEQKAAGRWLKLTSKMTKIQYHDVMVLFKKISEKLYFLAYEKKQMFKNCAKLSKRRSNLQTSFYNMSTDQTNLIRYITESELEIEDPDHEMTNGLNRKSYETIIDLGDCKDEIQTICKSANNEKILQCLHQKVTFLNIKCLSTINSIRAYEMSTYRDYGHASTLMEDYYNGYGTIQ